MQLLIDLHNPAGEKRSFTIDLPGIRIDEEGPISTQDLFYPILATAITVSVINQPDEDV